MKKLTSILLLLSMLFTLAVPAAFAADSAYVSATGKEAKPGDEVEVIFSIVGLSEGFINAKMTITCDAGLTLTKLEPIAFNGYCNVENGSINHASATPVTAGEVVKATFTVDAEAGCGEYKVYGAINTIRNAAGTLLTVADGSAVISVTAHKFGAWVADGDVNHKRVCEFNAAHFETEPHNFVDGVCSVCGFGCVAHDFVGHVCSKCGFERPCEWSAWTNHNASQHKRVCAFDATHVEFQDHTFVDGVCSVCGCEAPDESTLSAWDLQMLLILLKNQKYTINATAGKGGTITPAGVTKVKFNASQTYIITPAKGYEVASVLVNGKDVGAVTEYTFKNVRSKQTISATFKKIPWVNPFKDIDPNADYYEAVEFVCAAGIMNGISATEFGPNMTITRAMFVTVLGRLHGVDTSLYTKAAFKDVKLGEYYAPYVQWAAENGIVLGYDEKTFGVNDEITVEQALTIIARYAEFAGVAVENGKALTSYKDAKDVSDWAVEAMEWAIAEGIYVPTGKLNPQAPAARALVAVMIYNYVLSVIE